MAIKFSQFNLRTDHTEGMYLVGYDGNQNIHITVDNLFDDFINGTENTIAMFGTDGTELVDSILSQNAGATLLTVAGQLNVDAAATFDTSITVTGDSALNGNVTLGDASTDLITQTGTLYLNGPVKDTTDTLGVVDQVLLSDATGELTFTDLADLHVGGAEVVEVPVKNVQGSALVKGDPVYISGSVGASGRLEVQLADASNALKMPAVGLLKQDLANNAQGFAVVTGKLRNLTTDPIDGVNPTENDVIYVKPSGTSGAALTTTKPVYSNFIQNIGKVGRVSTSNDGNLVVSSILRTNDIPNLTPGRLWVGSTGNTIESQTIFVDEANTEVGIGTTDPYAELHIKNTVDNPGLMIENEQATGGIYQNSYINLRARESSTNTLANGTISIHGVNSTNSAGTKTLQIRNQTLGGADVLISTLDGSNAAKNPARFKSSGQVQFEEYGSGTFTGTATKNLAVDSSGNIIETEGGVVDGSGTTNYVAKWSDPNTLTDSVIYDTGTNVGIGTATPGYSLDVQTTGTADLANFETSGTAGIRIANSNQSSATRITTLNSGTNIKSTGYISFQTDGAASGSGTERMIIENSTGDVGIGTTPDTRLHVKDDASNVAKFETFNSERSSISLKTDAASNNQAYLILTTPASGKKRVTLGPNNNPGSRDMLKIEKQILPNYTAANMNFGGTGVGSTSKFALNFDYNTDQDSNFNGFYVDANLLGTAAITADKTVTGINVDMDSVASGGNTTQELALKGINVDVVNKTDGDANHIYGVFSSAKNTRTGTGDNMTSITGGYFQAFSSAQSGQVSNMYGVEAITYIEDATHTVNNAYAVYGRTTINDNFDDTISSRVVGGYFVSQVESGNDSQVPQAVGVYAENEVASDIANIKGVEIVSDINGGTTANSYLVKGTTQIAGSATVTNNWGLYLADVDKNYLDGTLRLPTYGQGNVTGTATKNLAVDSNGNVIETDGGVVDGSGTANYVSKWSDPNTLTDSVIYDDGTNVGIGTTTPAYKLSIQSPSSAQLELINSANSKSWRPNVNGTDFYITETGVSNPFVIKAGGNVGIGTTSPGEKLSVSPGGNVSAVIGKSLVGNIGLSGYAGFKHQSLSSSTSYALLQSSAGETFLNASSTESIKFRINNSNKMILTNAGNVGIGMTSPTSKLTIRNSGSGNSPFQVQDSGGVVLMNLNEDSSGNAEVRLNNSSGTQTVRLDTSGSSYFNGGNVGIGTTTPATIFHIAAQTTPAIRIEDTTNNRHLQLFTDNNSTYMRSSTGTPIYFQTDGANTRMFISSGGQIQFSDYGSGAFTGTATKNLAVDSSGNVIETDGSIIDGSGTANYVSKWSDPNTLTDSVIYDNGTNVGIGTTNPTRQLTIFDSTGARLALTSGSSANCNILFGDTADDNKGSIRFANSNSSFEHRASIFDFQAQGSSALYINSSRNVGIGITSPTQKLDVAGNIGIDESIIHNGDTDTKIGFVANDNFAITTNGVERVRVTSGGSVGIATNNPGAKLDVEGNAVIGSTLNTATGQWAVAIGNDNTASALDSLATGENTTASGRQSFSGGFNSTASGNASFAVGGGTTASGENSFAANGTTVASGISSAAFGAFSEATATNAFAINGDTTASGESSFSAGVSTNARGLASIATGQSCGTSVSANGAFAGGTVSNANAQFSIAYGDVANASGRASQALGYIVNATAQYSFAQGFNNTVSGTASAVFGQQNSSTGTAAWSLSTGFLNTTRDSASLTVGSFNGMTASSASREQFMLGRYLNVPRDSSGIPSAGCLVVGEHNAYSNRPNVKFAVGTGVGVGAEQDSFTVLKDGNVLMEQIVNKNYSSDSAAASGGVPVGGIYHNAGDLKIRLT